MKIAVTGHTQGIGKRLYERYSPNCIGFSKSTGYDIMKKEDRLRIISESSDCDVFVNNACSFYGQTLLLINLVQTWKDQKKTIINVGSRVADINLPLNRIELLEYQSYKVALKEMSNRISLMDITCDVQYKSFAYVGTEAILQKYPNFTKKDYITEDEAVDLIMSGV